MTSTFLGGYVNNHYDCYRYAEWLQKCIAKKIRKGQPVTVEHLANCSTMKTMIREGVKMCKKYDGETPDKEERAAVAMEQAEMIIENARYLAAC